MKKIIFFLLFSLQVFSQEQIQTNGSQTEFAFVFVHGLYMDSDQFAYMNRFVQKEFKANTISITLPGHGLDSENRNGITYKSWLKATDEAITKGKRMGRKIILVGQSTGGTLLLHHVLTHQEQIAGMILIEPALGVQGKYVTATCLGKLFFQDAHQAASAFGIHIGNQKMSLKMGCEVGKIFEDLIAKANLLPQNHFEQNQNSTYRLHDAAEAAASRLHFPVLVMNNTHDEVIQGDVVDSFFNAIRSSKKIISLQGYHGGSLNRPVNQNEKEAISSLLRTIIETESVNQ